MKGIGGSEMGSSSSKPNAAGESSSSRSRCKGSGVFQSSCLSGSHHTDNDDQVTSSLLSQFSAFIYTKTCITEWRTQKFTGHILLMTEKEEFYQEMDSFICYCFFEVNLKKKFLKVKSLVIKFMSEDIGHLRYDN